MVDQVTIPQSDLIALIKEFAHELELAKLKKEMDRFRLWINDLQEDLSRQRIYIKSLEALLEMNIENWREKVKSLNFISFAVLPWDIIKLKSRKRKQKLGEIKHLYRKKRKETLAVKKRNIFLEKKMLEIQQRNFEMELKFSRWRNELNGSNVKIIQGEWDEKS